jgi:antitoxin ParD1/3/4
MKAKFFRNKCFANFMPWNGWRQLVARQSASCEDSFRSIACPLLASPMTISLSPELRNLVQQEFSTGRYETPDDVLLAGVRLLRERNRRLDELRSQILPALDRFDRGEGEPLDMEGIKAEARRRLQQHE